MSGSRPEPAGAHLAEQHLGDRLSALVDGELGHESRERVLAHLATCARCKAEADAQRRLKNVFAEAAPPPPSASLLARLQGLPAGGDPDGDGMVPPGGLLGSPGDETTGGAAGALGVFGARRGERFAFGYVPARPHGTARPDARVPELPGVGERGFRIHSVGRPDDGRSASRGLRFAVAAAGAVSLAAVALGTVTTAVPGDTAVDARGGSGAGSNVIPARSAGTGTGTGSGPAAPETQQRRRSLGPLLAQGGTRRGASPSAPTSMSAPLVPGLPAPASGRPQREALPSLNAPMIAGAAAVSPLIRPLDNTVVYPLTAWSTVPGAASGLLPVSAPDAPAAASTPSPATPDHIP